MIAEIANDWLCARISDRGAELLGLCDSDGNELIWGRDKTVWEGSAPILFPVIGQLRGGRYTHAGAEYAMPKHGIARRAVFDLEQRERSIATFTLRDGTETLAVFPFPFELVIVFALHERALSISARLANRGKTPMPCNFGFHPAFCWPLPFGGLREDHRIVFDEEEAAHIRRVDQQGLLLPQEHATPVQGRILAPEDSLFADDALIFEGVVSRRLCFGVPGNRMVGVNFEGFTNLGIWTKPGARFLCIEPWSGLPDCVGSPSEIDRKSGIGLLAPGEVICHRMTIEPYALG